MANPRQPSYSDRALGYCKRVVDKKVIASKWVRLAAQRHIDDLKRNDWRWTYDEAKAKRVCQFIELLSHEKGHKQDQHLLLEDWQVFFVCSIFGWVDITTRLRRFREAVLMVSRKNGKSPMAAAIALYMGFFDSEPGSEVYCGASTEKQAWEVFRPSLSMLSALPDLCERKGIEVNAKSIVQTSTRSRYLPVIGKPGDGAMPHCFIGDEAHEWPDASLYDTMATGMVGRLQPLRLIISTAGETIEGPCYQKQRDVELMLDGTIPNERLFGIIYTADPGVDWTTREALIMANPNMGVSVQEEILVEAQAEAVRNAAKQNIFRCKHLGHWMTASTAWMNMESFRACADSALKPEDFKADPCWLGSDLASKIDLSATVTLFRREVDGKPHFYCFTRTYLPEAQIQNPSNQHYQRWANDGHLISTPGNSIDYARLEQDAISDVQTYQVRELAFDRRYADSYAQRVNEATGITTVEVPPNPAQLSPAMKELEAAVMDGRFHYDGNPVLTWAMGNVLSRESGAGNLFMPTKPKPEAKIDPAIALFIAISRARLATPVSGWFTPFVA